MARLMTAKFLHGEIREKGGAYGGGAKMGGGLFSFYSYRWASGCAQHESFLPDRVGLDQCFSNGGVEPFHLSCGAQQKPFRNTGLDKEVKN